MILPGTLRRFVKFGLVGVVGLGVDTATLYGVIAVSGLSALATRPISFLTAATATWALNRHFTFADAPRDRPLHQWLRFIAANAVGFAVNLATSMGLLAFIPFVAAHPFLALAAGSLAGMLFNFTASSKLVFRVV